MVISETKLDESFSNGQFKIPGYALPFCLDRNQFGGGIMVFVREDIPSRVLSLNKSIESLFIELNFRKKKWLLCCAYNPNRKNISSHLDLLRRRLDLYSAEYEHFIIVGDFNTEVTQTSIKVFCDSYEFKNLIKDATCYKNPENPSCIDLILANNPNIFQNSGVIEASLSDFHKMTVTVLKTTFEKLKPNIIHCRDYRKFSNDKFRENLISRLSIENIRVDCNGMEKFLQICIKTLDELAPQKKKYSRGNNMPFINKTIKKAFMKRSRLRNIYLKNRSDNKKREYNKQRNYCVSLLRKTKTNYYANLNEKDLTDNKQFWRTVKSLLSDKIKSSEKITLVEQRENLGTDGNIDNEIVNDDVKIAEIFNRFFSNAVIDLKISDFHEVVPLADNISYPIFRAILKYANHPSTIAIKDLNYTFLFIFSNVSLADVKKEIRKLDPRKASQNTDIPVRILKQNSDIFGNYICDFFNECVDKSVFPSILKNANITPVFKKGFRGSKDNY